MRGLPHQVGLLQRVDGHPVRDEIEDVIAHLEGLLNSKREYGSFNPDLGLSISDAMWSSRPMVSLARHVREQIVRFEPRLRDVHIEAEPVDDHLCPAFRIYGKIGSSTVRLLLSLHTVYCTVDVKED